MGFESRKAKNEFPPGLEPAYQETHRRFSAEAIDPHDFLDIYGPEIIHDDQRYVERMKSKFETNADKKFANIFEAVMYDHFEQSDWLGPHAHTEKTAEYDDIKHGIDLVVEFDNPDEERAAGHLALAVDVTFGTGSVHKKFERIREEVANGQLGTIKYFRSDSHGFTGRLDTVPHVVVGVEKEVVAELANLWMNKKNAALGEHPVQRLVLEEMKGQLVALSSYARRNDQDRAGRAYSRALGIIKGILDRKTQFELGPLKEDRVYQEILQEVANTRQAS